MGQIGNPCETFSLKGVERERCGEGGGTLSALEEQDRHKITESLWLLPLRIDCRAQERGCGTS